MHGRGGEITYTDHTGQYSIPVELIFRKGYNYLAYDAIDVETGRWVIGERAARILAAVNEGFFECDRVQLYIGERQADCSSLRGTKSRFMIGDREVSFDEFAVHQKTREPKDGDQSPFYGPGGVSPLDR